VVGLKVTTLRGEQFDCPEQLTVEGLRVVGLKAKKKPPSIDILNGLN